MAMEALAVDEVYAKALTLKDDERIYITIDREVCRDLQYIYYRRQAMENLFMSYLNNTTEEANEMNLKKFTDVFAQTYVEQAQTIEAVGIAVLGQELYTYLSHSQSSHRYTVDYTHHQLVIHPVNKNVLGACGCQSCSI